MLTPPAPAGVGAYVPWVRTGNLIFTSGQLPWRDGKLAFTGKLGDRVQIIGDDYLVTSAARVAAAASRGACNAVLLKPNQAGTVTETKAALDAARKAGWRTVVSARSGETEDVTIVHLAVGWNAGQLKVGSFARSERMAKWNEGLRIQAALGPAAPFARWRPK